MTTPTTPPRTGGLAGWLSEDAPPQELIARCVHCGFCLPTCPTYAVLGLEQDSPRGRIRLMKTVWDGRVAADADALDEHIYRCLDCRACETACPSGVEFGKLVEATRAEIERARPRPLLERVLRFVAFRVVLPEPRIIGVLARLGFLAKRLGAGRVLHALPLGSRRIASLLDLLPDRAPSARPLARRYAAAGTVRARVALFEGCVMRGAFAWTNEATARVLARNGVEVLVPEHQTCCGALHVHAGEPDDGRALARRNIAALEALDVDAIVVNAAGCGANLKEYGWLLRHDPAWHERAERFAAKVKDATELLGDLGLVATPGRYEARVTWDDPCHLLHGQRVREQPRALLAAIPGLDVIPLAEADWCCGSAGIYNVTQPALSQELLARKVAHIAETGAEIVVTANPGCLMQLDAGLRAAGSRARVVHLIDLLEEAYARA